MVIPGQASSSDHGPSIAIIGSGFSGVGLAIKFLKGRHKFFYNLRERK